MKGLKCLKGLKDKNKETLKILTYNIQVSIPMDGAHHYFLRSWRHFFPHEGRLVNLKDIAEVLKNYDLVGLQEVDAGSMRSSFINQVSYLGKEAGFLCWEVQVNRDLKFYAQHANGILSRVPMSHYQDHKLPAKIPGRGVMTCSIGQLDKPILVAVAHLSLTESAQEEQLDYIADLIKGAPHVIVMGDLNIGPEKLKEFFLDKTGLVLNLPKIPTYPSWKPTRKIDYVLTSPSLKIAKAEVLLLPYSDHLPVSVEVYWPE